MRKYAILTDNKITEIVNAEESEIREIARSKMIVDIEDLIPEPGINWILQGNKLVPPSELNTEERDLFQQTAQRKFGEKLLPIAVDKIGARNLKLVREGNPTDVATLASQMASIKILLEGGALKTARGICSAIKPMHPNHSDILDEVISAISNFLTQNGWE
jgi:hypothetical protein